MRIKEVRSHHNERLTKKHYDSPEEEILDPHPKKNVLVRNFSTSYPFDKIVTDVTEYKVDEKKIYIISEGPPHWSDRRICG